MVTPQQAIAQASQVKQQISQAQIQAAGEQQRLSQIKQQLTSQQQLRSATRQGQVQIKTVAGRIEAGQKQLAGQQRELKQAAQEVKAYEETARKQQLYEEGYKTAYEWGTHSYYLGSDTPKEFLEGYKQGKSEINQSYAQYGGAATTLKYGTEAEKGRVMSQLGIPSGSDITISKDLKSISYTVPDVGTIFRGPTGEVKGIESPYFGKTFTNIEAYNKAVEKAQQPVIAPTPPGVKTLYGTDIKYTTEEYAEEHVWTTVFEGFLYLSLILAAELLVAFP